MCHRNRSHAYIYPCLLQSKLVHSAVLGPVLPRRVSVVDPSVYLRSYLWSAFIQITVASQYGLGIEATILGHLYRCNYSGFALFSSTETNKVTYLLRTHLSQRHNPILTLRLHNKHQPRPNDCPGNQVHSLILTTRKKWEKCGDFCILTNNNMEI